MIQLAVAPFFQTNIAEALTAAAAALTFFAALGAIYYAHRQLSAAKDTARVDLTFRLYEHQLNPEFAKHIALTADFITIEEEGAKRNRIACKRWRKWEGMDRSDAAEIVLYLNHLEAVGGLYEQGRLDETAAMRLFGQAAAAYWKRADWFVKQLRSGDGAAAFDKWEALAKAYESWKRKGA
jgi:CRISPR/Cas system-associated endonuclease Cas1